MPTKAELIRLLEDYPDDTMITLWGWHRDGAHEYSTEELLNPTCAIDPTRKTFQLMRSGVYLDPKQTDKKLVTGVPTKKGDFIAQGEYDPRPYDYTGGDQ